MQMKVREEREAKRATMDGRHEYILSTVADRLGMTVDDAEEFMLDGDQVDINSTTLMHCIAKCLACPASFASTAERV